MKFRKPLALLLTLLMVLSLAACGPSNAENTDQPNAGSTDQPNAENTVTPSEAPSDAPSEGDRMPNAPTYEPTDGEKYTVELTADGWYKIVNDGGDTLGLHPNSGVKLVEDDGYAFKDLNQNGQLDPYEDWRLTTEERTDNLISLMKGEEMAAILSHGGWGGLTTDWLTAEDASYTYLAAGGRGGVTRGLASGVDHAKWTNSLQAVAESGWYGIPAMVSIDPMNISGLIESVALASTMDPEMAAQVGIETSKQYRASGVTAFLGPQVDIASPVMKRAGGTYGEDPQLTLDIATAYVNAMQSTYVNGEDQGWGAESVYCFTKHYGGAGSTEGGRDDHSVVGRYAVFPGNNLEAHLITYFDGVFKLPGKTGSSGIMTQYAVNVDGEGNPYGGEWAGAYNPYLYGLLDEINYNSLKITDWGVFSFAGVWGAESLEEPDRVATGWERGVNLLGGYGNQENVAQAYKVLVERNGQEGADKIVANAAGNYITVMMNLEMFENPYNDSAYAGQIVMSDSSKEYGLETQRASVVMIKNDGTIKEGGAASDKPTVYIPYTYNDGFSVAWSSGVSNGAPSWNPGFNLDVMKNYFNVVTDTLGDPTGAADKDGNPTYTADDLTRATAEEIAACDYILVSMSNPYRDSYDKNYQAGFGYMELFNNGSLFDDDVWYPVSLQYGAYTADTARDPSISGMIDADGNRQNRSYKGQTAEKVANYGDLEALEYAASVAGDIPVIVAMNMDRPMVWTEVEPLADVILVTYQIGGSYSKASKKEEPVAEIILGKTEPNGLLVFQQPADMAAVEAQVDDVPRDMKCYVDANGNTYDFAFGLNWSGVINDSRVQKYSADPLTKIKSIDYSAYEAANK